MTPHLICLDCDGVIVDSERISNKVLADDLTSYGLPTTVQDCVEIWVGGTFGDIYEKVCAKGIALPDTWVTEIYEKVFAELRKGVPVFGGLFEFLDKADALNIPLVVVSNGPMNKMELTLNQHGLLDRLHGRIYSGYTKGNAKPDPGMILDAMTRFDATPERTWMVDDSRSGLTAGIRAGVQTFAFVPDGEHVPDVNFYQRVTGFDELLAILNAS